jgi:hypothetical protein
VDNPFKRRGQKTLLYIYLTHGLCWRLPLMPPIFHQGWIIQFKISSGAYSEWGICLLYTLSLTRLWAPRSNNFWDPFTFQIKQSGKNEIVYKFGFANYLYKHSFNSLPAYCINYKLSTVYSLKIAIIFFPKYPFLKKWKVFLYP